MDSLPYLAQFNYPSIVIGIDPSIKILGIASIRIPVIEKLIEEGKEIVGADLYDNGLPEGIVTTVFRDNQTQLNPVNRMLILVDKVKEFVHYERATFIIKRSGRLKRLPIKNCKDIFIVIEVPETFNIYKARKGNQIPKLACVIGGLFAAFPEAHKRIINRSSTLKENARMILMNRMGDEELREFWRKKSTHEIDAYVCAEWFIANKLANYYEENKTL